MHESDKILVNFNKMSENLFIIKFEQTYIIQQGHSSHCNEHDVNWP